MITFAAEKVIMEDLVLTPKEKDLIRQIRNYRRAFPNGARALEMDIMDLVYELMEEGE